MQAFYLARQPIYDAHLKLAGYELLFRGGPSGSASFVDGDQATSEVLASSVVDIGLDHLVGEFPAFINATGNLLHSGLPLPHLKDRVVLEVLEDVEIDADMLRRLGDLAQEGYRLALDDFVYRPDLDPLLALADYVKLDVQALSADELAENVAQVRRHSARLLAEKVEDYAMLESCRKLGFDLYQGFFFCRPRVICGQRPEANRLAVIQLIARLQDPNADMDDLERLVTCDPALSYRLLKYINSAYCGMRTKVTSIRQALVLVGTALVRSWASLVLMARLSDGKPHELITTALIRARMCESLGQGDVGHDRSEYFTVGLLSVLDALLDVPMDRVVEGLPFEQEVRDALSSRTGTLGAVLSQVIHYERGIWQDASHANRIADTYLQALGWALDTQKGIGSE